MPALKRKFVFDPKRGGVVEITKASLRRICDQVGKTSRRRSRKVKGEKRPPPSRRPTIAKWPIHSEAMAVDPEDVGKAQEILRRHGVQTDYDRLGRPVLRGPAHRKAHAEALGFYDRNGGYGDPQPTNR